jgi:predicted kinase
MMVGLPGTGKSSVVNSLKACLTFVVVSTDDVRKKMRSQPSYTTAEMMLVYDISYAIIRRRLAKGQRVVFDASNYLEARREYVTRLAKECGAPVATCYIQADQETISRRLRQRNSDRRKPGDLSDADWAVYKWMVETQEPIIGEHLILDTSIISTDEIAKELTNYWLKVEANAANDPYLQPPGWASQLSRTDRPRR